MKANVASLDERREAKATVQLHNVLSSLKVSRVAKRFSKYELHLTDGKVIELGTAKNLLTFRDAQAAIAEVTGHVVRLPKRTKWENVAQTILDAVEVEEDFSFSGDDETRGWLERYCQKRLLRSAVDMSDSAELFETLEKMPKGFRDAQGNVYVSLEYFMRFVYVEYHTRLTLREAVERLGRLRLKSQQIAARQGDELRRRRLWFLPQKVLEALTVETD